MDEFSIEILASAAGVAAIVVAIISLFRVLWPWGLSVSVLRILSVVLGVGLAALASLAFIGPVAPEDDAVAPLILFWLFVSLNGATAGLAASAAFDTAKYGIDRTTVKNGVAVSGTGEQPAVVTLSAAELAAMEAAGEAVEGFGPIGPAREY